MDITVYLPDELGKRAKRENVNLSRMLRDALIEEFQRRDTMKATLDDMQVYEVEVEDDEGKVYTGRITGSQIAYDESGDVTVFLTDDERVIVHDGKRMKYWVLDDPEEQLRGWLGPAEYYEAVDALGITPVVDL